MASVVRDIRKVDRRRKRRRAASRGQFWQIYPPSLAIIHTFERESVDITDHEESTIP